jgi:CheY-like chemotaxis protein
MGVVNAKRILVIDEEAITREILRTCLSHLGGWQILTAGSVSEGLLIAEQEYPDAIIIDVLKPGFNGATFLNKMRQTASLQSIPVVILSEGAHLIHPEDLPRLGVVVAIAKPFDPKTLTQYIAELLYPGI